MVNWALEGNVIGGRKSEIAISNGQRIKRKTMELSGVGLVNEMTMIMGRTGKLERLGW